MNKSFFLLTIIGVCFVISCNNRNVGYTDSLSSPSEKLYAQTLNDSFILASPKNLFLYDSLLLVMDKRCGDNLFYIFSTSDGVFLKGGGKKGEGPGEVLSPDDAHLNVEGILSYWDINKNCIIRYNIKELLSDSNQYFNEVYFDRKQMSVSFLDVIAIKNKYIYIMVIRISI